MTVTTLEPTMIEDLDWHWQPSCESPNCLVGHPTATHIQIFFEPVLRCGCKPPSQLICPACTQRILGSHPPSVHHWHCSVCGATYEGFRWECFRIEPLP